MHIRRGAPAGSCCSIFLRQRGVSTLIVTETPHGLVRPDRAAGVSFSPVPIFPVRESKLTRMMTLETSAHAPVVTKSYVGDSGKPVKHHCTPGAYAESLVAAGDKERRHLVLSLKLFGQRIFTDGLPELRSKVARQYRTGQLRAARLGYTHGLSPYSRFLQSTPLGERVIGRVVCVDLDSREVTAGNSRVAYHLLVSCIPMPDLLSSLCGVEPQLSFESEGAQFYLLRADAKLVPNSLVYDCDIDSPVYRAFAPNEKLVITQIAKPRWGVDPRVVCERIGSLLRLQRPPRFLRSYSLARCYPLGASSAGHKEQVAEDLARCDVLLFGRFGRWEYKDLHELDWSIIDDIAEHL